MSDQALTHVAVGILLDGQGRVLLTSRPLGKVYAGYWEFPGGKIEAGETPVQALSRELHEELGIDVLQASAWKEDSLEYTHAKVRLHYLLVTQWQGDLHMKEGQDMVWTGLPVEVSPVLPGTVPVLAWLAQESVAGLSPQPAGPQWLDAVRWDAAGLVPAIVQERGSKDILMMAWMNREALQQTLARGQAVYWSRSRQKLWHKGEESGHVQTVHEIRLDCDADVILLTVTQTPAHGHSVACHTGRHSCFYRVCVAGQWLDAGPVLVDPDTMYSEKKV